MASLLSLLCIFNQTILYNFSVGFVTVNLEKQNFEYVIVNANYNHKIGWSNNILLRDIWL